MASLFAYATCPLSYSGGKKKRSRRQSRCASRDKKHKNINPERRKRGKKADVLQTDGDIKKFPLSLLNMKKITQIKWMHILQ